MVTEKDLKVIGLKYFDPILFALNQDYDHTDVTFGKCPFKLHRLKNAFQRFMAYWFDGADLSAFTNKHFKHKVIKIMCDKQELMHLTYDQLTTLEEQVLEALRSWNLNIDDVIIYGVDW